MHILYIDTSLDPKHSLVESGSVTSTQLNSMSHNEKNDYTIIFTNNGVIDTGVSGVADTSLKIAIATKDIVYATSSNWYVSSSYGYTGSLDLTNATALSSSVHGNDYVNCTFVVRYYDIEDKPHNYLRQPITVYNALIV